MGFADDFANNDKIEKMSKFSGAKGGTFDLKSLQRGDYIDVKFREIKRVFHEKTTRYSQTGAWSSIAEIISISGKGYTGMEVNIWLSENIRICMGSELRRRKTPVTEQEILNNYWRIFVTQNKNAQRTYGAVLVSQEYVEDADTQAPSGGVAAEDMFR